MTDDRVQKPCLDEKKKNGKRIDNYRKRLERFKQYTKRKYDIDIGPPIKEETIMKTNWNTRRDTKRFLLGTRTRSNAPNNTVRLPNRTRQN